MKTFKTLLFALCIALAVPACKKKTKEIYSPSSKLEGINDVWQLNQVKQYDPKNKDLVVDVTDMFTESAIELNLNSADFTYAFNQSNPLYLGTTGTWNFDDNNYPTKVTFTNGAEVNTMKLLRTIRTVDPTLELELTRYCAGGTASTVYQLTFVRK
jgi:tRNA A37 threonylcarbamoyladenosine dehydratase